VDEEPWERYEETWKRLAFASVSDVYGDEIADLLRFAFRHLVVNQVLQMFEDATERAQEVVNA
jgi:hypothetical protein